MPYRYHYDPNQPRVPAGQQDGGQWMGDGNAHHPTIQRTLFVPVRPMLRGLEAVLELFEQLTRRNSPTERAILRSKSRQYTSEDPDAPAASPILIGRDELERICKRFEYVQTITNSTELAERPLRGLMSPTQYGTRIHSNIKSIIDGLNDPNLRAEVSYLKFLEDKKQSKEPPSGEEKYGTKNTIRVDVLERTRPDTVCVYDIKTGQQGLSSARYNEIGRSVLKAYGSEIRHIIITEVRPTL